MKYPIAMMRQDSISIDGEALKTVGENMIFNDKAELLYFKQHAVEKEVTITNLPFLFGLFGGSVVTETRKMWVLP